jgi:hypothetical protein
MDLVIEAILSDGSFPVVYTSSEVVLLDDGTYALGLGFSGGTFQIKPQDWPVYD